MKKALFLCDIAGLQFRGNLPVIFPCYIGYHHEKRRTPTDSSAFPPHSGFAVFPGRESGILLGRILSALSVLFFAFTAGANLAFFD
ncbi:hypothetical protein [Victivallis sp.]|uniref:hypothetical protein n=1 Tax=Victivallis sp. TaxID=2049020 RepID=UPI003A8F4CDC